VAKLSTLQQQVLPDALGSISASLITNQCQYRSCVAALPCKTVLLL